MGQSTSIDSRTILVVEDDALTRLDLIDFFGDHGWHVYGAEDADRAVALLDRHADIEVVLMDVQMPGSMNGVKLAHYIRERFPPTMLFVVSGRDTVPPEALPERATFLPKPFDRHRMLRQIEQGRR